MKSKALAAVTAVLLSAATGVTSAARSYAAAAAGSSPAYAGPLCEGWGGNPVPGELDPCSVAPYTTHNFQNEYKTSYWGMPPDQDTAPNGVWANCTNYVAFVESTVYGVAAPKLPVNAKDWAKGARDDGFAVNQTPTVGSVAQWYAGDNSNVIGKDGHVAIVEQVGPDDSYIVVSQDNWHTDTGYYGWALILNEPDTPGAEPWPDNFIHFVSGGHGAAATLSYSRPDRLIQSTGNLYWTADQTVEGRSKAVVYRASKTNQPGQERILYQELSLPGSRVDFEAIAYANVRGTWYGYFVANYPSRKESQIKRVPLTGGAAVVLATSPAAIGNRDLVTDGSSLYWADAGGIRKMAITGGTVRTLVSGKTFAHLGLDGRVLYYSSGKSILSVPASGGASTTVISAPSPITAMYPPTTANGVLWGEANGSVDGFEGDIYYQLQAPVAGVSVTSVSVAGNYVLWADCFPQWCQVDGDNGSVVSVATSGIPVDAQGDAGAWYWGDSDLEKFTL
jgi:surface antigen